MSRERGHYGPSRIGQYSCATRYVMDPEYRRFRDEQLHREIGDKGISTQGEVILGVAATLIIGIGIVGTKKKIRWM